MSRLQKFQNIQVFIAENVPLNGQIFINNFIVNFANGFISNGYGEDGIYPAVNCCDGHMETWENGVLNNSDNFPAVSSPGGKYELWTEGHLEMKGNLDEKDNIRKGCKAEIDFADYLDKHKIPYIHFDQDILRSNELHKMAIKMPDYLICIDKKPFIIEVKATGCYLISKNELKRLNALKDNFLLNVIIAITEIDKDKFDIYKFMTLETLNNYLKIKNTGDTDTDKLRYCPYSKLLLKDDIIHNNLDNDELENINSIEKENDVYHIDEVLEEYFKEKNYVLKERKST